LSRRLTREVIFKALFQADVGKTEPGKALQYSLEGQRLNSEEAEFASRIVSGVVESIEELDQRIIHYLVGWELDRLAAVDRCLLRMALYEILYVKEIPPVVSINEAIELAKKYSNQDSAAFINGVLDQVAAKQATEGG